MKLKKYAKNPILSPNPALHWEDFGVLNPAVIYDEKQQKFIMLYRAVGDEYQHRIRFGLATSEDGYTFTRYGEKPVMDINDNDPDGAGLEDPRLIFMEGRYYLTYASRTFWSGRYWLPREERIKQGVIYRTHFVLHNSLNLFLTYKFSNFFIFYLSAGALVHSQRWVAGMR